MTRQQIRGWHWEGTDKWWPAVLGDPPSIQGVRWVPLYFAPRSDKQ